MPTSLDGSSSAAVLPPGNLLQKQLSVPTSKTDPAKLMSAAKEFESVLLGQWLQGAESSFGAVPGGDDDQDAGDEQMKGFAVQQLAKSFSDSGGIGIAALVSKALAHSASGPGKP